LRQNDIPGTSGSLNENAVMTAHWGRADLIVRSEVLGLQPDEVANSTDAAGVWLEMPVFVVDDGPEQLVTFTAPDAPSDSRTGSGPHPTVATRGTAVPAGRATDASWCNSRTTTTPSGTSGTDPTASFVCWYLNLQTAFVRTPDGYRTQDLELDLLVFPDGTHIVKDEELLDDRVAEGRYSAELVAWIRRYGQTLVERLNPRGRGGIDRGRSGSPIPRGTTPRSPEPDQPVRSGREPQPGTVGL
jgi:hypothetical protein